jgi:hypothetical protein
MTNQPKMAPEAPARDGVDQTKVAADQTTTTPPIAEPANKPEETKKI